METHFIHQGSQFFVEKVGFPFHEIGFSTGNFVENEEIRTEIWFSVQKLGFHLKKCTIFLKEPVKLG